MMEPKVVFLFCDESGEKGFAHNKTEKENDIGVFAGYSIPKERLNEFRFQIKSITDKFKINEKKTHITDMDTDTQKMELRNELFNYLNRCTGFYFFYEAIRHRGYHKHYEENQSFLDKNKHENDRFKTSQNTQKHRLHTKLFQSMFSKQIGLLLDLGINKFEINVITDNIDKSVLKEFEDSVEEILNLNSSLNVSGYDSIDKVIKYAKIESQISGLPDYRENLLNYSIKIATDEEDKSLIILADVLANSILYHLNENTNAKELNNSIALKEHPLINCMYPQRLEGWITDKLFAI